MEPFAPSWDAAAALVEQIHRRPLVARTSLRLRRRVVSTALRVLEAPDGSIHRVAVPLFAVEPDGCAPAGPRRPKRPRGLSRRA